MRFVFTSPRFSDGESQTALQGREAPARGRRLLRPRQPGQGRPPCPRGAQIPPLRRAAVGCGDNSFLRVFDSPAADGFEIDAPGTRRAGRSAITTGDWSDAGGSPQLPAGSFQSVTAFDILEHLPRIKQDLALVRKVLKPAASSSLASAISRAGLPGPWWAMDDAAA